MHRGYGIGINKYKNKYLRKYKSKRYKKFATDYGEKSWKKKDLGWIKDILAVLLFLLLFPYFAISFKEQKEELMQKESGAEIQSVWQSDYEIYEQLLELPQNETYFVTWQGDDARMNLPVEIFMVGALAASIDVDYGKEALKAQAIVLRSTLCQSFEGEHQITLDESTGSFWNDAVMQRVWGEHYATNLKKCVEAVWETQGIYMACRGKAINGCYHGMSAGKTRDPHELSATGEYDYLRVTDCVDNLSAPDYIQEKKIKKENVGELELHEKNEEGYVISLYRDKELVSGESFREELDLASSNFEWKEENGWYIFTTKGRGHGFGMDQYYANILAGKGENYQEILNYFFTDITFERME